MKKTLSLSLLALASSAAMAQSSVQVYGLLDVGVSYVNGLKQGKAKDVVSGIMEGSRLGFKGTEDLGGGYRAIFTMEHRLEADTGGQGSRPPSGSQLPDRMSSATLLGLPTALQPAVSAVGASIGAGLGTNVSNNFWDRQVYVGLVTPVGAVLAGRQYTPAYEVLAAFDTLGTQSSLSFGQIGSFPPAIDIRLSNSVAYRIQQGGFSASAMVAEGSLTTGRMWGLMGMYKSDSFSLGLGYNTRENERGDKSLTDILFGGSLALGPGSVQVLYGQVKDENPSGLSGISGTLTPLLGAPTAAVVQNAFVEAFKQDAHVWQLGYKLTTGPHTVYVAYNSFNDRRPNESDVDTYGAAYSYAFSKRTDVNFVVSRFNNKGLAQVAPGGAGYLGGVTASAGTDSTNVAMGLRHRF
jgi:predicted porin